jgi:serine/threonine protein kinase
VHQIVQRDIKPSNILMCPSDSARVRLIDFGIGRHLGAHVVTRPKKLYDPVAGWWCVVGTLGYRSQNAHDGVGKLLCVV